MKQTSDAERARDFHIGRFEELDDFPWLWEKFMEDDLWEEAGYPRVYSHREGENRGLNAEGAPLFDLALARFNRAVDEHARTRPDFCRDGTLIIEFSRGGHGGYTRALPRLSDAVLERAAILYIDVCFDESWRRNIARYKEKLRHSSLAHMATRKVMEIFYRDDDWKTLTGGASEGTLGVGGRQIPFVTMGNEPELTECALLAARYRPALERLMALYGEGR